jgi:hypothetical protein
MNPSRSDDAVSSARILPRRWLRFAMSAPTQQTHTEQQALRT